MHLFDSFTIRDVRFRNRIGVSPMCQYSSVDGESTDWHLVHLGSRAVGGAGIVMTEAAAIEAIGRISDGDLGIYSDEHIPGLTKIAQFIEAQGGVPGIQLAHAGRKGSTELPWLGGKPILTGPRSWKTVGPSPLAFDDGYDIPHALDHSEIAKLVGAFETAARRAVKCGFQLIEIHAAHGYLLNEFLSPKSNLRTDDYGGSFENRCRFLLEVTRAVRFVLPPETVLAVRISASEWVEDGWSIEDTVTVAKLLKNEGVDIIDCSSGGNIPGVKIAAIPGYQVPFAARVREGAEISTAAVGMIVDPRQALDIVESGSADFVFLAREMLRDPYWPRRAADTLGCEIEAPQQYSRGWNR